MKLILAPFGRCATNSVSLAIAQSCQESWIGEPFDPQLHNNKYSVETNGSIKNSLRLLESEGVTLVKHLYSVMSYEDNKSLVENCSHILFLYRSNFVDQYISSFMCEELVLHRKKLNLPPINKDNPYFFNLTLNHLLGKDEDIRYKEYLSVKRNSIDIDHLKSKFEESLKVFNECKQIFRSLGKNPVGYSYEDIYWLDIESVFSDMCLCLDCKVHNNSWREILSFKNKMFKEECKALIPNYEEVISLREDLIIQ
jgi:hypothetical protein|tara:strand:+ start:1064 stop:1825 length:762 start_codon:yes stop_codon:yes gene_type:complete